MSEEKYIVKDKQIDASVPRLSEDAKQNFQELERFLIQYTEQMDLRFRLAVKNLQSLSDTLAEQRQAFSEYKAQSDAKQKELEVRLAALESLLTSGA